MVEATPTTFELADRDGSVSFEEVQVHRVIETDKAGRSKIHVWLTGRAIVHDDQPFQSIAADVAFSLFDGSRLVGVLTKQGLQFDKNDQSLGVTLDEGLYIDLPESITQIEAQVETTKIIRGSAKLKYEQP